MIKRLILLLCFVSLNAFASIGETKDIDGVHLYSEYYKNSASKFKGTIVFINGSGTSMREWGQNKKFFNQAKHLGSLFLYDRSGLGGSPINLKLSGKNPITAKLIGDQLEKLLKSRRIPAPYIIVAHSYGAMYAGYFVLTNPKLVKGLLLVDSVPRNFKFSNDLMKPYKKGILMAEKYSAEKVYQNYTGSIAEVLYQMIGFQKSKDELKKLGAINNQIPVVIVSSTKMEYQVKPIVGDWYKQQKQWLNKNKESKIFQVKSGHFIQIDRPNVVVNQIKKLIRIANKKNES